MSLQVIPGRLSSSFPGRGSVVSATRNKTATAGASTVPGCPLPIQADVAGNASNGGDRHLSIYLAGEVYAHVCQNY